MRSVTGAESDLGRIFDARSIAVVGASSRAGSLSWWPLRLLSRYSYAGAVYPVNPNRDEIDGRRCYPAMADLPEAVDLAIVALDAERSVAAVHECLAAGARAVVLPAQGFGEHGPGGRAVEEELVAAARAHGARLVGPNTDGLANLATGVVASIQPVLDVGLSPGPVAVVSQSGATAASIAMRLAREGLGCRYYASVGNESDLGLADYLSFVLQDPEVRIVLSFVEGIRRPAEFRRVAALAAELGKPIVLIKVGGSEQGARRAAAHTGALAGDDALAGALLAAEGVLRVGELSELVAVAKLFLAQGAPRTRGVGVISVSGGQAGAVADRAGSLGVEVPALGAPAERALDEVLRFGGGFNPCDLTGQIATDPGVAGRAFAVFAGEEAISTVVYSRKHLTGSAGEQAAASLAAEAGAGTLLAVYSMDGHVEPPEAAVYAGHGIPVFESLGDLFAAVSALAAFAGHRPRLPATATVPPEVALADGPALLAAYGIQGPRQALVHDAAGAAAAAATLGPRVVLKVEDPRVPHRTEAGGVALGVRPGEAAAAHDALVERVRVHLHGERPAGVLVQEQVEGGVELIAGVKVDPALGPFVLVGLGGVAAEVLRDTAVWPAPFDEETALRLLRGLRGAALLDGFRGAPPADLPAAARAVAALSRLAADRAGELAELDVNPLVVLGAGAGVRALDVLVVPA